MPEEWADAATDLIFRHRQALRAGVPMCSCDAVFSGYASFDADHARLLGTVLGRSLAAAPA